jgi:hypothetical protein
VGVDRPVNATDGSVRAQLYPFDICIVPMDPRQARTNINKHGCMQVFLQATKRKEKKNKDPGTRPADNLLRFVIFTDVRV